MHDYLLVMRGAERAFAAIADCWPEAPIYTSIYSEEGTEGRFRDREIHTTYLQHLGVGQRGFRRLLPLYPRAVERLPVQGHDLVISSSSAFAHGVRPMPGAIHVCYCYTPFRYAWHERDTALAELPRAIRPLVARALGRVRRWDLEASQRVTHFIAISELTRQRIQDCYERDAIVIHPPVEVERFTIGEPEGFLLVVTELVRHKRVDVALEAARMVGMPIKAVGEGPELIRLRASYPEVEFLGRLTDAELATLYPRALALVVPNLEEFGIAAVEAQAAGRPVVALAAGGALETVIDGRTGVLVNGDAPEAFASALRTVDLASFSAKRARANAERFSTAAFKASFQAEIARVADGVPPRSPNPADTKRAAQLRIGPRRASR